MPPSLEAEPHFGKEFSLLQVAQLRQQSLEIELYALHGEVSRC